jgi:hypothetical protein
LQKKEMKSDLYQLLPISFPRHRVTRLLFKNLRYENFFTLLLQDFNY